MPAMFLLGPFLFVWAIAPNDGGEINPGVGMVFMPFFGILAASMLGYAIFALTLWRLRVRSADSSSSS
jgi:hypothetical protein